MPLSDERVIQAAVRVLMEAALTIIEADPHTFSKRPCESCKAVSAIIGRAFGCVHLAHLEEVRQIRKGVVERDGRDP